MTTFTNFVIKLRSLKELFLVFTKFYFLFFKNRKEYKNINCKINFTKKEIYVRGLSIFVKNVKDESAAFLYYIKKILKKVNLYIQNSIWPQKRRHGPKRCVGD